MVLLIDNYDSFSYNIYQLVGGFDSHIRVIRNDEMTVEEVEALNPGAIILSPGPGRPEDAGICCDVVRKLGSRIKILGICLGHQAICQVYGGEITYAKRLMHGRQSEVLIQDNNKLFTGMNASFLGARYHSLAVNENTISESLMVTAKTADGEIMAVEHQNYPVFGVQFHPESVLTPDGEKIIENFMKL